MQELCGGKLSEESDKLTVVSIAGCSQISVTGADNIVSASLTDMVFYHASAKSRRKQLTKLLQKNATRKTLGKIMYQVAKQVLYNPVKVHGSR